MATALDRLSVQALAAYRRLEAQTGEAPTSRGVARELGRREGDVIRALRSLRSSGHIDPSKHGQSCDPATQAARTAVLEERIEAVRRATRERGRALTEDELAALVGPTTLVKPSRAKSKRH